MAKEKEHLLEVLVEALNISVDKMEKYEDDSGVYHVLGFRFVPDICLDEECEKALFQMAHDDWNSDAEDLLQMIDMSDNYKDE